MLLQLVVAVRVRDVGPNSLTALTRSTLLHIRPKATASVAISDRCRTRPDLPTVVAARIRVTSFGEKRFHDFREAHDMASTLRIRCGDGRGYQNRGSVLVNRTADGVGLQDLWLEIQAALAVYNGERSAISSLVSFRTTRPGDSVPQNVNAERFEEATEYGVPQGISDPSYLKLGFTLKDYDLALRSTWKYLRVRPSAHVEGKTPRPIGAAFGCALFCCLPKVPKPPEEQQ